MIKPWIKIERIPAPLASAYEKASRMVRGTYYRKMSEEIVARVRGGLFLDVGTGPGYLPIAIAQRSSAIRVVGVDLSRPLIRMARMNAAREGLSDRLTFEVGNAARLRFADESFDMVISTGVFHSLKAPVVVLREVRRVLREGGQAIICDPARVGSRVDRKGWWGSMTFREKMVLKLFQWLGLHRPIETFSREQAVRMLRQAGFSRFQVDKEGDELKIIADK
jgi:ubiquinone/menaquinone biosynthesis C-methylase UbiE